VLPVRYKHHLHIKSKAISVAGSGGLQDCEKLTIPHCPDSRLTDDDEVFSLTRLPPLYSPETIFFLLLVLIQLETE
jgi:hypothetical protein